MALGVLLSVPVVCAWFDAKRKIAAFEEGLEQDRVRERQRVASLRRPAIGGAPIDASATVIYTAILDCDEATSQRRCDELNECLAEALREPFGSVPPQARRVLAEEKAALDRFHEAVRCRSIEGMENPRWGSSISALHWLPDLIQLEGRDRLRRGDPRAFESFLELIRLAADLEEGIRPWFLWSGPLKLIGDGAHDLAQLVETGSCPTGPELEQLEHDLDLLDGIFPTAARLEGQRIVTLTEIASAWRNGQDGFLGPPLKEENVPDRSEESFADRVYCWTPSAIRQARALEDFDAFYRDWIQAEEDPDPVSAFERVRTRACASRIQQLRAHQKLWLEWGEKFRPRARAWFVLVRTAVRLERYYEKEGTYPRDASALLLGDPSGRGSLLQYESDGQGYKVASRAKGYYNDELAGMSIERKRRAR